MDTSDIKINVGLLIDIELPSESENEPSKYLKSQILDIIDDETYIIAAPFYKNMFYNLHKNVTYKVLFGYKSKGLYYFKSIITDYQQINQAQMFTLKRITPIDKQQRREYFRYRCIKEIFYKKIENSSNLVNIHTQRIFYRGLTKNISGSGLCIVIDENLNIGDKLEVILPLDDESMIVECTVIRNKPRFYNSSKKYELGLAYENIADKNRYKIIKFIFKQQRLDIIEEKKKSGLY